MLVVLACMLGAACKHANETCFSTPSMAPLNPVNLKFISKSTGADLIFSPGAPYKFSDLQVASSISGHNAYLYVDSAQKNNPVITMLIEGEITQDLTVTLGALPVDTIRAVFTTIQKSPCYSATSLSSIYLDGKAFCNPCSSNIQLLTIAK